MAKSKNVRICRQCGSRKTRVVDVRQYSGIIRRMRLCNTCKNKWTTVEIDEWWFDRMRAALYAAEGMGKDGDYKQKYPRGIYRSQNVLETGVGDAPLPDGAGDVNAPGSSPVG